MAVGAGPEAQNRDQDAAQPQTVLQEGSPQPPRSGRRGGRGEGQACSPCH